jgi:hypothetical protein
VVGGEAFVQAIRDEIVRHTTEIVRLAHKPESHEASYEAGVVAGLQQALIVFLDPRRAEERR